MALKKKDMQKGSTKPVDAEIEVEDEELEEVETEGEEAEVEATEEVETAVEAVDITVAEVGGPAMVSVLPNQNGRFYYGDRYYDLIKGQTLQVPKGFKERLKDAGMLEVQ